MSGNEFDKIWRLLGSLFPGAAAKKGPVDKSVWKHALEPYDMTSVSDQIMVYARRNKFFPDLADITAHLIADDYFPDTDATIIQTARIFAHLARIEAPDFSTAEEAMDWFHGLEGQHE